MFQLRTLFIGLITLSALQTSFAETFPSYIRLLPSGEDYSETLGFQQHPNGDAVIWIPSFGAGNIQFKSGATGGAGDRITFTNEGRIGIGTTSPDASLVLDQPDSSGSRIKIKRGGSTLLDISQAGSSQPNTLAFSMYHNSDRKVLLYPGGNSYFTNIGNFGIGTTNPTEKFHVSRNDNGGWSSVIDRNSTSGGHGLLVRTGQDGGSSALLQVESNHTDLGGNGVKRLFVVDSSGRVGVGHTDVNAVLDVKHVIARPGSVAAKIGTSHGDSTDYNLFQVYNMEAGHSDKFVINGMGQVGIGTMSPDANLVLDQSSSSGGRLKIKREGNTLLDISQAGSSQPNTLAFSMYHNSDRKVLIYPGGDSYFTNIGNFGVGTHSPAVPLDVQSEGHGIKLNLSHSYHQPYRGLYMGDGNPTNAYGYNDYFTQINSGVSDSNQGPLVFNHTGYQGGTQYFRDTIVANGKQQAIAFFDGSTGHVGIGTTSPDANLVLGQSSSSGGRLKIKREGNTLLDISQAGSSQPNTLAFSMYHNSDLKVLLYPGGDSYFTNIGNFGIGTTNPTEKFHVSRNDNGGWSSVIDRNSTSGGHGLLIRTGQNEGSSALLQVESNHTDLGGNGVKRLFVVDSSGRVGVGHTDVNAVLDVKHVIARPGSVAAKIGTSHGDSTDYNLFQVYNMESGHSDKFVITGMGRVGIGTTNPQAMLSVNGKIEAEEIKVIVDVPADYVFEDDYHLPSLSEVHAHIQEHKHLPNVPSADKLVEQGWDVGKMQNKLLEKVEELTLYLIQQDEKLNNQQSQLSKLEEENQTLKQQLHALTAK